jgi:hypothetical protein
LGVINTGLKGPARWRGIGRPARNAAAFLAGLLIVGVAIHGRVPLPEVPQVTEKLRWLAQKRYDTIFLGSSRVRSGIAPAVFDAEMAARGWPTRSYNFGVDALTFPELSFVFDCIAAQKPKGLRRVFVEVNPVRWNLPELEGGTLRAVYWHTLHYTAVACEAALSDGQKPPNWRETPGILAEHLSLLCAIYGNLGRGFLSFRERAGRKQCPLGADGTGYYPVAQQMNEAEEAELLMKIREAGPRETRPPLENPVLAEEVARLDEKIRRRGYEAYFIIAPGVMMRRIDIAQDAKAAAPVTFEFDDAARFPELYDPGHRYDVQHLNAAGSVVFTKLLARAVGDFLSRTVNR